MRSSRSKVEEKTAKHSNQLQANYGFRKNNDVQNVKTRISSVLVYNADQLCDSGGQEWYTVMLVQKCKEKYLKKTIKYNS